MLRFISLFSLIVGVLATTANAQSSISVVGRLVNGNGASLDRVKVTLGIGNKADPRDRIVSDRSSSSGLFQLAKSTVGSFSELYLWIEEPYTHAPMRVAAVKTDMWRKKLDDIVLERTLIGAIPPDEAAERVAAIFSIEQVKVKLGIQTAAISQETAKKLAKVVLAKCDGIQKKGTLQLVVTNAAKLVDRENAIFSETQQSLLALAAQDDFMQLVQAEQDHRDDVTRVLTSYLQGRREYSPSIASYVNGLNDAAIRPEWFVGKDVAQQVWKHLRPKTGDEYEDLFVVGTLKLDTRDGHGIVWKPTSLHVDANVPPNAKNIEKWFQDNPNNAKSLLKAIILADPDLPSDKRMEIDRYIKVAVPIVTAERRSSD